MFKVYIEKREYNSETDCEWVSDFVSVDAIKPDKVAEEEWDIIESIVLELAKGNKSVVKDIKGTNCKFDLERIDKNIDWGILAESEHYYIRAEYEDAVILSKPNSKRIASVGDHYGDPADAYIDPEEKFCITVGCGKCPLYENMCGAEDKSTVNEFCESLARIRAIAGIPKP